ncbi:MAG: FKBP-type peptidyl-prolyl cis-trans isomerase, partial [Mucinivorans sp.]
MKIAEKTFVGLTYTLTVDGAVADQATAERPLEFLFGIGMLLPEFEKNIDGKEVGQSFKFTLSPENGYGVTNPEAVVELPKDIFMVDGKVVEEATTIGSVLPMGDNQGNRMMGKVISVGDNSITMDFNHPMAGKVLNFEGQVVSIREAT